MSLLRRVPWRKLAHWAAKKALEEAVKRSAERPSPANLLLQADVAHPGCDVATAPEPVDGKPGRYACVACGTEFSFAAETASGVPMPIGVGRRQPSLSSAPSPRVLSSPKDPRS